MRYPLGTLLWWRPTRVFKGWLHWEMVKPSTGDRLQKREAGHMIADSLTAEMEAKVLKELGYSNALIASKKKSKRLSEKNIRRKKPNCTDWKKNTRLMIENEGYLRAEINMFNQPMTLLIIWTSAHRLVRKPRSPLSHHLWRLYRRLYSKSFVYHKILLSYRLKSCILLFGKRRKPLSIR